MLLLGLAALTSCRPASVSMTHSSLTQDVRKGSLLVADQQSASASIVDLASGNITRIPVGEGPHEAVISNDGRWGVVSIYGTRASGAGNQLAIIDIAARKVSRMIDLGRYTRPHDLVFLPGLPPRVLATSEATGSIIEVNLQTNEVAAAIETHGQTSHSLALTADGGMVFTANMRSGDASQMDVKAREFVRKTPTGPTPEGIAVTPDGKEVWVGSNEAGTITILDGASGARLATIPNLGMPYRLAISPDGNLAAIADPTGNRVHIVDVKSRETLWQVAGLGSPRGVEIAPDNRTLFITLGPENAVAMVDMVSHETLATFPVGTAPDGVGWGRQIQP